jgi:hypothetical protein
MKQIARELGVSPGTVHRWTCDIELTNVQRSAIEQEWRRVVAARVEAWSAHCRDKRRAYQEEGRARARRGDALHQAGCMLYWAEGAKDRNSLTFANSDVHMIRFFTTFLRESLGVPDSQLALRLNVYTNNGLTVEQIEGFWLDLLGLPKTCLRAHSINHFPTSSSGRRRNKLPHGVCTLRIHSTKLVQHVFGAIQEYAGCEEPEWLDCGPARAAGPAAA